MQTSNGDPTAVEMEAQQWLHFLRILRELDLKREVPSVFYHCSIESVLTYCISVWFQLHRATKEGTKEGFTAQGTNGHLLSSLQDLYSAHYLKRECSILGGYICSLCALITNVRQQAFRDQLDFNRN